MTPEQRAAAERVRGCTEDFNDVRLCCDAFVAEHPADDDEPVTLEELESAAEGDERLTPVQVTGQPPALWVLDAHIGIKDREQLRALLKGLGR